jgi:hypothetical protein
LRRRRKAEEQEIKKLQTFRKTTYPSRNFPDTNIAAKTPYFFISPLFRKRKPATAANIRRHFPYSYTHFPVLFFPLIILLSHTILSSTAAMRTSPLH